MSKHWPLDFVTLGLIAAAAEEGSISRAARRSNLALAAASRRISDFEQRVGMRIFKREARGVRLTTAAEPLLMHVHALLAAYGTLSGAVEDVHHGLTDHLRLLATSSAIAEFLPSLLARFAAAHPHVRIEVDELTSSEIIQAILKRRGSIGVLWADIGTHGLAAMPLGEDELVLVTPLRHALARRRSVRFADTLKFDYVMFDAASPVYLWLSREAARLGSPLKGRIQVRGLDAVCRMAEAGLGIGVVPRRAADSFAKSMAIAVVTLREPWARRRFCVVYRSADELAPIEKRFLLLAERSANAGAASAPAPRR